MYLPRVDGNFFGPRALLAHARRALESWDIAPTCRGVLLYLEPASPFGTLISPLSLVRSQVLPALQPFSPQLGHLCHDSFKRVHSMFLFVEVCECICALILRRLCYTACVKWINISAHTQTRSSSVALRRSTFYQEPCDSNTCHKDKKY